jgi:hypothetical protein
MKNQKHDRIAAEALVEVVKLTEAVECAACHNKGGLFLRLSQEVPNCAGTKPIPVVAYVHLDCIIAEVNMGSGRVVRASRAGDRIVCLLGEPPDYDS